MRRRSSLLGGIALTFATVLAACSTGTQTSATRNGKLAVVAAESSWGSIARQLGGDKVDVKEIVNSPDADPHDYEPTPADARDLATARYVILNGLGYDAWASDLVNANESEERTVLDIGDLLGLNAGDNPHRWYFPDDVTRVIDRITADFQSIDPANASYYARQHDQYVGTTMRPYRDLLAKIRAIGAGTPVGASESAVEGVAQATGLDLTTPASFLDAISEGNDPDASDKVTVDDQIENRRIAVFIANSQNATPDVQRLVRAAHGHNIPVVSVTETPVPAGVNFQDWQTAQLQQLANALTEATG
ncbi:MAG TPA: zinc ABC transporter substrate-binding protein [Acidimicrobiales bacterium]|jgi:zinc/manganese transport system substrate-binding protein|nr:zinc ABC transporter substrate-binding protein [Acidimicrobiales bacterium]